MILHNQCDAKDMQAKRRAGLRMVGARALVAGGWLAILLAGCPGGDLASNDQAPIGGGDHLANDGGADQTNIPPAEGDPGGVGVDLDPSDGGFVDPGDDGRDDTGIFPDSDGDGVDDGLDGCPNDPAKTDPGDCGCGLPDVDSDADGTADCNDGCPDDPDKIQAGLCGCGESELDSDGDGAPDCVDSAPNDANQT